MSIFAYLKEDHREIQNLLQVIEQLGPEGSVKRDETFNQFKKKLILHSKAEERAFYKLRIDRWSKLISPGVYQ